MTRPMERTGRLVDIYDQEAEATGWRGPEVAFGVTRMYLQPGQSILDLGIGTGLGSIPFREAGLTIHGMDISPEMLDACRSKGFTNLTLHDLRMPPYPYDSESMDCIVCLGVMPFFSDLSPMFLEAARILHRGGLFVFMVYDRSEGEEPEILVEPELTHTGRRVTMYRHDNRQIAAWNKAYGFALLKSLAFTTFMDRARTRSLHARVRLQQKIALESQLCRSEEDVLQPPARMSLRGYQARRD